MLRERIYDHDTLWGALSGKILGIEQRNADVKTRGHEHGIPERPLLIDVQFSCLFENARSRKYKREEPEEFGQPRPRIRLRKALHGQFARGCDEFARNLPHKHAVDDRVDQVQRSILPPRIVLIAGIYEDIGVKPGHEVRRGWVAVRCFGSSCSARRSRTARTRSRDRFRRPAFGRADARARAP